MLPGFDPPATAISSLAESINTAAKEYGSANGPNDKLAAAQKLQRASDKLARLATPLQQQLCKCLHSHWY